MARALVASDRIVEYQRTLKRFAEDLRLDIRQVRGLYERRLWGQAIAFAERLSKILSAMSIFRQIDEEAGS